MKATRFLPLLAISVVATGCVPDVEVIGGGGPPGDNDPDQTGGAPPVVQGTSHDLDLLLVVDNSIGMVTKQQQLAQQVEVLIRGLLDPPCVTAGGDIVDKDESGSCPSGSSRPFSPVNSLHVGLITSSLGDLTGGACAAVAHSDDHGHLVDRQLTTSGGFLVYEHSDDSTPDELIMNTRELILGADQLGCGYEMPLEATLRFLVDPAPYESLAQEDGALAEVGLDQVVLDQRAAFLRPTSSLAVVMLSDEEDCSIDVSGYGYLALKTTPFFKATSECASDPNDACCTSCALLDQPGNDGCDAGGNCTDGTATKYEQVDDHQNLRCWDQKRRYGVDFHYPVQRYVNALSSLTIDPSVSDYAAGAGGVPNPLFAGGRDPSQVTFLTMGGVPWQDIVVDPSDNASRYRTADELTASGTWDWITGAQPADPFMVQHFEKRSGTNPANGADVAANNDINGGDRTIPDNDWLQYACISPLAEPITESIVCSDCDASCDDPVCDGVTQIYGYALPGSRAIEVARGLGSRGRVASVCRELDDHSAMDALLVRVAETLE